MKSLLISLFLFFPNLAANAAENFNFTLSVRTQNPQALELHARPKDSFHFNLQAPNRLSNLSPLQIIASQKASSKELVFILPQKGEFKAELYTCDAAQTFCRKETAYFSPTSIGGIQFVAKSGLENGKAVDDEIIDGFLQNNLPLAMSKAGKLKQNILLDFAAIWCPACLKLENDVFKSPEFKKLTDGKLVKVRVDLDWAGSGELRERYHILDVPTLVLLNSEGEELGRIHEYRPKQFYLKELEEIISQNKISLKDLALKADQGDSKAADQVGLMAYDSLDYPKAIHYWKSTERYADRLIIAQINQLDSERDTSADKTADTTKNLIGKLKEAIERCPESVDRLEWSLKLAQLYGDEKKTDALKQVAQAALSQAQRFLQKSPKPLFSLDSSRDDVEVLPGDLYAYQARAQGFLGLDAEAKKSWQRAIAKTKEGIRSPKDKGRRLLLVRYLKEAGLDEQIDPILADLQKLYPLEYTFYYKRAARLYKRQGKPRNLPEAESLGRLALSYSYGANFLSSAVLLAKILKDEGKASEARDVAQQAISGAKGFSKLPPDLNKELQDIQRY
jgi:thioredoxin-related protein